MNEIFGTLSRCALRVTTLVSFCLFSMVSVAAAQGGAVVRTEPVALGVASGAESSVEILFENVQDLYGLEVHLTFDPTLVEVVDADATRTGVQITGADWLKDAFIAANQVDNASGKIDFGATLLNPASPVNGSKAVATITFKAKQDGIAPLTIDTAILATRDGGVIESQLQDGQIETSGNGKPLASSAGTFASSRSTNGRVIALAGISLITLLAAVGVLLYVIKARRVASD